MDHVVCSHCHQDVAPSAPRSLWKLGTVFFWVVAMVTATVFSLLLGLNLVLVPLWLPIGLAVGVAARRAATATCPVCGEELSGREMASARLPRRREAGRAAVYGRPVHA